MSAVAARNDDALFAEGALVRVKATGQGGRVRSVNAGERRYYAAGDGSYVFAVDSLIDGHSIGTFLGAELAPAPDLREPRDDAPTLPAPPLSSRTRDELARSGAMLSRARGIDAMTREEVLELLVDLALAQHRALELLDELAKRSLPR